MSATQPSFLPPQSETLTPLMAQYRLVKEQHEDCLLFFRLGDFYELFFEDAIKAAKILDIALTRRGQHNGQDVPMCGVPAHSYEGYLAKLIRAGQKVAICEQTETPDEAKKRAKSSGGKSIVRRDVVRIVTPGTVTEDSLLDVRTANYLACVTSVGRDLAVAWCDLTAGSVQVQVSTQGELAGLLARLDAGEILIAQRVAESPDIFESLAPWRKRLSPLPNGRFDSDNAARRVMDIYNVGDLAALGDFARVEIAALGALLDYAALTQKTDLRHLARPLRAGAGSMFIDAATRRNLELTRTLSGERHGSLLSAIDRTETGAGARLLATRLAAPLIDVASIKARLDAVAYFVERTHVCEILRAALRHTPDLERALSRLMLGRGGPRDLAAVRDALSQGEAIRSALLEAGAMPEDIMAAVRDLGEHTAIIDTLTRALAIDLPMLARDGHFIALGYAAPLDELVMLRDDGKRVIAELQQKYVANSGVSTLKIKHNHVIGYHIEVSPSVADKLLTNKDIFIHRQTLASAARFTTVELSEMERKITEAGDKALAIELQLFADLVSELVRHYDNLRRAAQALACLDVAASLAARAVEGRYVRPVVDQSLNFTIVGGRHPVVEQALMQNNGPPFIANDCDLQNTQRLWLLTGPNMAGKSTFLRQNALIALLAQIGSFVPAASAHIGVVDRLFSRVGAADDLAAGRSTFMVEMVETAAILNQAGDRALVILDEIGRGTATYDGLSIAWAVLEHLHEVNHCRALFATHYHELTTLSATLPALRCTTMRIKEWEHTIHFLHEVIAGCADRSYGLHVAQMAGLPAPVIARAATILEGLEQNKTADNSGMLAALPAYDVTIKSAPQKKISAEIDAILTSLDPDALSPKQALDIIYRIKKAVG